VGVVLKDTFFSGYRHRIFGSSSRRGGERGHSKSRWCGGRHGTFGRREESSNGGSVLSMFFRVSGNVTGWVSVHLPKRGVGHRQECFGLQMVRGKRKRGGNVWLSSKKGGWSSSIRFF